MGKVPLKSAALEHGAHIDNAGGVPLGDIPVEGRALEHPLHGVHLRDVPTGNIPIERQAFEQGIHAAHARQVQMVQIAARTMLVDFSDDAFAQRASGFVVFVRERHVQVKYWVPSL